jgi:hypothetical protein
MKYGRKEGRKEGTQAGRKKDRGQRKEVTVATEGRKMQDERTIKAEKGRRRKMKNGLQTWQGRGERREEEGLERRGVGRKGRRSEGT